MNDINSSISSQASEYIEHTNLEFSSTSNLNDADHQKDSHSFDAEVGDRLLHYVIDVISINAILSFGFLFGWLSENWTSTLIALSFSLIYYFVAEFYFGRTVGKLFTKCEVVNLNDGKASFGQILLRSILRFIPLEPLSFVFGGNWHDRWSHTKVVKL